MKNLKSTAAGMLILLLSLSLCACGGKSEAENTQATQAPVVTEAAVQQTEAPEKNEEDSYTVIVVDENGSPIAGAMVQLCKDTCYPGVTDADGTAKFTLPEDDYKVSFLTLPTGYTYSDEAQEFHFADGSKEITISLKAAE